MLFMLVDTSNSRYRGGPDPDDERERRWEPVSLRLSVPAVGSVICFALSPAAGGAFGWALTAGGVALCAQYARVSLRDAPRRRGRP